MNFVRKICSVLQFISRAEHCKENCWSTTGGAETNNRTVLQARVLASCAPHTQLWGWGMVFSFMVCGDIQLACGPFSPICMLPWVKKLLV